MKRFETLVIAIPDPTLEEQVEGQARRDRAALVHAIFHHPWLVSMAEGDWRNCHPKGAVTTSPPKDNPDAWHERSDPHAPPRTARMGDNPLAKFLDPDTRKLLRAAAMAGGELPITTRAGQGEGKLPRPLTAATLIAPQNPPDAADHPAHYTSHPSGIEPIAITRHESFVRGNAIECLMRAGRAAPDPRLDLRKARRYIDFELEDLDREYRTEASGASVA